MRRRAALVTLGMITMLVGVIGSPAQAAVLVVDDDGVECPAPDHATIGAAIAAATSGVDTVMVCPGTYAENVTLNKNLVLSGAQAGVDARGRVAAESNVAPAAGNGLNLVTGSAGSTIDGFTFSGGTHSITSSSGPITDISILNNRMMGFTGSGTFLNDTGIDMTIDQNEYDASSKTGGGGIAHFDTDGFDGLHFTNNDVVDGPTGTGLFVDGNHNVGASALRSPMISGNMFDGNGTGANLGRFAFEFGTISDNMFSNSGFDGLQGGIQNSTIEDNVFDANGRSGLALTGFGGGGDPTRGAQDTMILDNEFSANASEAMFFSSAQFPGTISTNEAHNNNIDGNTDGAVYAGGETIDVECNWWGAVSGPTAASNPGGTGDTAVGAGLDFEPWLIAPAPGGACSGPLPIPTSKDDCKKDGWMTKTDDMGNPFKNQGDCVSYVATGGSNKAAG